MSSSFFFSDEDVESGKIRNPSLALPSEQAALAAEANRPGFLESTGDVVGAVGGGIKDAVVGTFNVARDIRAGIDGNPRPSLIDESRKQQNTESEFLFAEFLRASIDQKVLPVLNDRDLTEQQKKERIDIEIKLLARDDDEVEEIIRAQVEEPHLAQLESMNVVAQENPVAMEALIRGGRRMFGRVINSEGFKDAQINTESGQVKRKENVETLRRKRQALVKEAARGNPEAIRLLKLMDSGELTTKGIIEIDNLKGDNGALVVSAKDQTRLSDLPFMERFSAEHGISSSAEGSARRKFAREEQIKFHNKVDAAEIAARAAEERRKAGVRSEGKLVRVEDADQIITSVDQDDPEVRRNLQRLPGDPLRQIEAPFPSAATTRADQGLPAIDLGKPGRQDAAKFQGEANFRESTASNMIDELGRLGPGIVGFQGYIADGTAGITEQVFSRDFSERLNRWVTASLENPTGVDARALSEFRVKARAFIARSVPEISGEKSGRITAAELALTEAALKILDPFASASQIEGALSAVLQLNLLEQDLNHALSGDENFGSNNLNTQEGWLQQVKDLRHVRFSSDPDTDKTLRAKMVNSLKRQRNSMDSLGGPEAYKLRRQRRINARD